MKKLTFYSILNESFANQLRQELKNYYHEFI